MTEFRSRCYKFGWFCIDLFVLFFFCFLWFFFSFCDPRALRGIRMCARVNTPMHNNSICFGFLFAAIVCCCGSSMKWLGSVTRSRIRPENIETHFLCGRKTRCVSTRPTVSHVLVTYIHAFAWLAFEVCGGDNAPIKRQQNVNTLVVHRQQTRTHSAANDGKYENK